ncbi:LysR family transcriptional regulator [Carbonactinospora thermoautotrophica]|uniref:Transcriptional regulator n=1 Tax=Carbonactinospora thermoautotrophica TaxID=1469144 RepID=A0A132N0S2_9ACTN|nr:LysR family transcriptional regulator [Carbonactinospora thermoautotrophica]KWX02614.1 Transcriptional regulator [Carbonactinospora thermoautotrophica]KWX03683.1 transcriptional regulator [Carbonactinospora thermoautotrophica]KWX08913.1 transcriptional regulator [Carbonactinospora thermoautotrophica]MCX9190455.1 LysR family transcriptional regulator [Carbonactinospora thermoautotrophica]
MFDSRHLRVLREVARTGSYSAAARELGYTQPAISQQMRALERAAGTPLVVRVGRRMRLTEAGEVLNRHAATILSALASAEEEVAAIAGLRAGRVRVIAFPSGSSTLVPAAIAKVTRRHPGLRVEFAEAEPPESVERLREGDCDIALAFSYDGDDPDQDAEGAVADLAAVPLCADRLYAVLPAGHRLARRRRIRLADLAGERWIAGCPRCRGHLVQACAAVGFTPAITFSTDDVAVVQGLVAADLGVALLPGLALDSVHHSGVVARPVEPPSVRRITAYTLPDLAAVRSIAVTLDSLREVAAELPSRA